jgi:hypothetical protein
MPLGAVLGVIGAVGGFAASKLSGGGKSDQAAQPNTSSLVDAANSSKPPSIVQGASNATGQAQIAASKQRKKAAAGDTLMTPRGATGAAGGQAADLVPKSLIGSLK